MLRSVIIAFIFAVIWFAIKVLFYFLGDSEMGFNVGVMSNLLFILIIIVLTLWTKFRKEGTEYGNIILDMKDSSKSGLFYVVVMSVLMVVYYSFIDKNYLVNRMNKRIEVETTTIKTENDYVRLQEMDIRLEKVTREEYFDNIKTQSEKIYNTKTIAAGGFLVLTITTFLYSLLISLLFRNFLFNNSKD